MHKFKHVN